VVKRQHVQSSWEFHGRQRRSNSDAHRIANDFDRRVPDSYEHSLADGTDYHRAANHDCGSNNDNRNANGVTDHASTDLHTFAAEYGPDSECYHVRASRGVLRKWGRCGDRYRR